jgi:hypothetical protein
MPIHDWTRVNVGIFHHFHQRWVGAIGDVLNDERLPSGYYALAEQIAGEYGPDVLTLEADTPNGTPAPADGEQSRGAMQGTLAVATAPPRVQFTATTEMDEYALKQNTLVVRHSSGDRVVALVEVVSPGNKASRHGLRAFVEKAASALYRGYHLLILDLHPPGPRDPLGIHGAIWEELADTSYRQPPDRPLTLAAYDAGRPKRCYVQPVAVGGVLPDMPLFLSPGQYVSVPLEATYQTAYQSVPQRWRRVLEATAE